MADRVTRVSLVAQVNSYIADMQRAQQSTKKVGESAEDAAAKFEKQNQAMREIGAGLTVMGAVATAATAIAVKSAIDWETAWAGVTKTVDGSAEQMAALEGELRNLATTLPATHQEIAAVAEAAGQLGVRREDVAAFTKTMIDLGETTNLSADEAATSLAQLMNVMGTAPDQVDNLGAALVALGNDGASTERDIVQMAQRIAGAGRIVGLTEGEVLGFANALASVGIEAEAGGSAISRIMTDIAKSVATGNEDLEKFAAVAGLSAKEFQKAFKDDSADAIATFVEGLGRINAEGGDVFSTLEDLGQSDIRVSQALLGMANSGDLLRKSLSLGNRALEENTALTDEAEKRYETTASKLQVMSNKVNDAAIEFGAVFLPALTSVAEAVGVLADAFGNLPDGVQTAIAVAVALAAAVGLAGGAFLLAIPKIAEFRVALGVLSASSIPAVAGAVTGLQAAATRTSAVMASTARFLMGPWGIALAAAAVGVAILDKALDNMRATSNEVENSLRNSTDGAKSLDVAFRAQGIPGITHFGDKIEDLDDALAKVAAGGRDFIGFMNQDLGDRAAGGAFEQLSNGLATLAREDLPAAQSAFRAFLEETDGSEASLRNALDVMPAFRDALYEVADAQNINIANLPESERYTKLLAIAMGDGTVKTESAADAYRQAAEEVSTLSEDLLSLIDAFNEVNGVGQDAVSTNARYQTALAGISEEVARQRAEFEEANGTLNGFTLSLDQSTVAGSSNAAMLSDVASAAQAAAKAQYEQDLTTMSATEATTKYSETLGKQREAFVNSALAAGYNADEVWALADQIFRLPSEKEVQVLAETASANSALEAFKLRWESRQINLRAVASVTTGAEMPGRAEGGIIPGAPSEKDNRVYALATGEFVVRSRQVSIPENRRALEYMNAGGRIRGFAAGGYVQPQYAQSRSGLTPAPQMNLDGMAITGRLDLGDGLTGMIDGRIVSASRDRARSLHSGSMG